MMQRWSDPIQQYIHVIGRGLFSWYCSLEDYCCLLAAYKLLLPRNWRDENVRVRHKLAESEYPRLSMEQLKGRLLDDAWTQVEAIIPQYASIVASLPKLKALGEAERGPIAVGVSEQLKLVYNGLREFMDSQHVRLLFEPADIETTLSPAHSLCCPPPPFSPLVLKFPPAGILRISLHAILTFARDVLYSSLREFGVEDIEQNEKSEDRSFYAHEIIRTFAGLEISFTNNYDRLFPCFATLTTAGYTCHPSSRLWLWSKLTHFELGQFCFEPIKRYLAVLWKIPELAEMEFKHWTTKLTQRKYIVSADDIRLACKLANLDVAESSHSGEGTSLKE